MAAHPPPARATAAVARAAGHNEERMIVFLVFMLIWLTITVAVIAVHFWFLSVPVLAVGGTLAVRRQRRQKELMRHRPGPSDPWLNEVVVAVADLDFDERERNYSDVYYGVPVEGYVGLRKQRVTVDVVLFGNQIQARHAEMALRTESTIRSELSREMAALHNGGRALIVARTNMGAIDEYDFDEIVRLVGEIPLPPPLAVGRAVAYRSPSSVTAAAIGSRTVTATRPLHPPAPSGRPAPVARQQDAIDQLERLGRLRESGVLTEAEFQVKKAELLQRI
jgi:Short C-terminal domain